MWLYPELKNVADLVGYYAQCSPEKIALIAGEASRSFRELDASTTMIAAALSSRFPKHENVAFIGRNSIPQWELLFGVIKAGCTWVPLNWRLAPAELETIIEDAECSLIFVELPYADMVAKLRLNGLKNFDIVTFDPSAPALDILDCAPLRGQGGDRAIRIAPDDVAFIVYTSGTTGKAKGVMISHQAINFQRLSECLDTTFEWCSDDIALIVMPNFHLLAINFGLMALYRGCTVSVLPVMDTGEVLATLKKKRPTITALVPTAIQMLLDHPDATSDSFTSLRLIIYGGAPIGPETLKHALAEMRCEFVQYYGITETTGPVTVLRPEMHDPNDEKRLKSCGRPLPLMDVKVVDAEGRQVQPGAIGELLIRTPSLFEGYWNNPTATAEVMNGGWYRSGDAGYCDAEGLFYVVDRIKDMIVTGGENVYSCEVEQALQRHSSVNVAAVVGIPDPRWGERVVAVVVLHDGATASREGLIAHCRTLIAGYKVPKEIHFATTLPLNGAGKVLKRALRGQLGGTDQRAPG